jgi:4-amino-4-deoxy-L-arabinose transferase-like glycosyltransferase
MDRASSSVYFRSVTDAGRASDDPEASGRVLFAVALLAGSLLRLILLGNPDLFGADEGVWAVGARNLVEGGFPQLVGLSATPLGEPSGTPVLFPGLLSVMVRIFGPQEWAVRLPSAVAGLVGAFLLERIIRRGWGQPAGHLAGAFAALFPPLVAASRAATVEPTLVALGLSGIIFGLRAFEEDVPWEGALAGAFFGLGFLAKGYAVGLFLLPLLAALAARPRLFGLGRTRRSLFCLLAVFLVVGGSHLLLVAFFDPKAFGFLLATAFGASEAAARTAAGPTAFAADLKTIVSTLFFFLPLVGAGVAFLSRDVGEAEIASGGTGGPRRLAHGALWGAYAVELLVLVALAGKLKLSSIPVMPALAAFAGLGGTVLLSPALEGRRMRREAAAAIVSGALVLVAAVFLMAAPTDPLFGGKDSPMGATAALAAIAVAAAGSALIAARVGSKFILARVSSARFLGRAATLFLTALLTGGGIEAARQIRHDLLTHRTGARETAQQIAPDVAPLSPAALAFRSPEPEALEFILFRTGRSWNGVPTGEALAEEAQRQNVRCWSFRAPAPPGPWAPPADVREWLVRNAREITADVDARAGRTTGLRVFVPR